MNYQGVVAADEDDVIIIPSSQVNDDDGGNNNKKTGKKEGAFLHHHLKVLLVEDDDSTRSVVSALLRICGYEVTPAESGKRAWQILENQESTVDLVLTDLMMPGLSGLELLSKIMSREPSKRIPVVIMSCHDSMDIVLKCLSRGAVDFLVKPVRKNELKNLWQHFWRMCISSSGSGSGGSHAGNNRGSCGGSDRGSSGLNVGGGSDNGSGNQSSFTKKKPVEVQSHRDAAQHTITNTVSVDPHPEKNINKGALNDPPCCKDLLASIQSQQENGAEGACAAAANVALTDSTLDLSLKRSRVKPAEHVEGDQNRVLHHSGGSAFSRYSNNPPLQNSMSNSYPVNPWECLGTSSSAEAAKVPNPGASNPQFKLDPSSLVAFNDMATAYAQSLHNLFYHGLSTWPPSSALPEQPENARAFHTSEQKEEDEHMNKQRISSNKVLENSGSECGNGNGNGNWNGSFNGSVSGSNNLSNNNVQKGHSSGAGLTANGDSGNNGSSTAPVTGNEGTDYTRLSRREVALYKFRQKRKERCFEKKVRYQSRKRLAEQRPRVRGQFVKQTATYDYPGNVQEEEGEEFEMGEDYGAEGVS